MNLKCINNKYIIRGPRLNNETDKDMTRTVPLTIGKIYSGALLLGEILREDDYKGTTASEDNFGFYCFNDAGKWTFYNPEWFQPI